MTKEELEEELAKIPRYSRIDLEFLCSFLLNNHYITQELYEKRGELSEQKGYLEGMLAAKSHTCIYPPHLVFLSMRNPLRLLN